jgi:hypothetical protein
MQSLWTKDGGVLRRIGMDVRLKRPPSAFVRKNLSRDNVQTQTHLGALSYPTAVSFILRVNYPFPPPPSRKSDEPHAMSLGNVPKGRDTIAALASISFPRRRPILKHPGSERTWLHKGRQCLFSGDKPATGYTTPFAANHSIQHHPNSPREQPQGRNRHPQSCLWSNNRGSRSSKIIIER